MKYTLEEIKDKIPEIKVKEYISRMEKKELIRIGIIAGAAGALTVTAGIIIAKKLKKNKAVQVVEVDAADLDEE